MYVLRPALRASTGRPPARFIRGRRFPSSPRLRSFHTVRALAQASNPPSTPDNTPIGENDASKPDRDKAAAEEQTDGAVATEDPDVLAQKLQRSRETSRRYSAALRRQQRAKKSQGLPPVHIPNWFLESRVIRREDLPEEFQQRARPAALSVSVSDHQLNEQATCVIPTSRDTDIGHVLSRLVRGLWGKSLDDSQRRKVERYWEEKLENFVLTKAGKESNPNPAQAPERQDPSMGEVPLLNAQELSALLIARGRLDIDAMSRDLSAAGKKELAELISNLDNFLADASLDGKQKKDAMKKHSMKIQRWRKKIDAAQARKVGGPVQILPLVLAEIRATLFASLTALRPSGGDSFASAKTNLILHSPTAEHEQAVDACVYRNAAELGSELIVLKAQDLAQLGGDYLGEGSEPSPRSIRSLGYETYRLSAELNDVMNDIPEAFEEEPDINQSSPTDQPNPIRVQSFPLPMIAIGPALRALSQTFKSANPPGASAYELASNNMNDDNGRPQSQGELQLEDMKITALLEALIDASDVKQSRGLVGNDRAASLLSRLEPLATSSKSPAFFDYSMDHQGPGHVLNSALPSGVGPSIELGIDIGLPHVASHVPTKSKIVYVKDFKELNATHYGGRIIQKLEEIVRKRRLSGESIMIVGSTCSRELTPELSASGVRGLQSEGESSFFRTIVVDAESSNQQSRLDELFAVSKSEFGYSDISLAEKIKFQRINLKHIQEMLRSLDPIAAANIVSMEQGSQHTHNWFSIFPESCTKRVLTYDEVHRVALTALGLHITNHTLDSPSKMSWAHVALAMGLLRASDTVKYASFDKAAEMSRKSQNAFEKSERAAESESDTAKRLQNEKSLQRQRELQRIGAAASKHEKRLMSGIADPDQIKTTFDQVHVPKETVDSIRTITSLSLLRPDAFNYGILATEKISGALLYGPPGTGKTLLAKAVAKESGSTVLEVSGSQIMDKYVGEGEKNVAAIFSLARKLSPCIVFLDEADALFASRDVMREKSSHRDILNQFLKEWDGLNDLSVFVMVATNRPFDLDDAVIRRLPRRLLVDLPTQADRKEILRIHLRGEQLDESIDLEDLSKRTPFYSGSDLKNVAVSAALACVKEENEQAALAAAEATRETQESSPDSSTTPAASDSQIPPQSDSTAKPEPPRLVRGQAYKFPERRILHARHFDKALQEIGASISEDMSSLNAIKKFDEQYGDRKGGKRRKDFGFGVLTERNENAARVRI